LTWEDDDWDGSRRRVGSEVTTSDVAELLNIRPATVRRWVSRGYLSPIGTLGPAHVFRTTDVYAARDAIWKRRRATGDARISRDDDRYSPGRHRPMETVAYKHWDKAITIDNAAELVEVRPSTIRSWIHRGHLTPLSSSTPRSTQLRTGDVVHAARARRLPRHLPPTWRAPTP
jgi:predicted site-specific integrase-resolvase